MEAWRLNRFLASRGLASRRACDEIIRAGRVSVNGAIVLSPGTRVLPGEDVVQVDGRLLDAEPELKYVLLNKPKGTIVTAKDTRGRRPVTELIPASLGRLFPVGRLDVDTEGLLLLTNDGALAFRLTHPRFGVEKTYEVLVEELPEDRTLRALRQGVVFGEGQKSSPARVTYLGPGAGPPHDFKGRTLRTKGRTLRRGTVEGGNAKSEHAMGGQVASGHLIELIICEGKKRQVRRMCKAVGLTILSLVRTGFGPLKLGDLVPGSWRELTSSELKTLIACAREKQ